MPAPCVLSGGPAQHRGIRGAERGEVVAYRAGQVPPVLLARGEGDPGGQGAAEVPVDLCGGVDRRRIEQRQPADLGERLALGRRERVEGLVQDRRDRAEWLVRVARRGERADVLTGALGAGRGKRRRRGPPAGRPFQPGNLGRADVQPEACPAQLQRLLRPQRQFGRGELGAVRPAQPRGPLRQTPGEHDEVLVGLQLLGEALDQQACAAAGVVGVVHDERAALLGQRAEQGVDRAHGILTCLRHGGRGLGKARMRRRRAQPGGEQLGGHAALVQYHLDGHRPPHVGQFRAQDGFAVPGSGLHDHDGAFPASCGQPWAPDVVRRQTAQFGVSFNHQPPGLPGGCCQRVRALCAENTRRVTLM